MLSSARTRLTSLSARASPSHFLPRAYYSSTTPRLAENFAPVNDPTPPKNPPPNVSETNAVPVDAVGARDAPLQETTEEGQRAREMQAPNREKTWSRSQQAREKAMTGPRFEQTIMEFQPRPYSAIELVHKQPVRWTKSKVVSCDGGGGPLGHPKIYINTDKPKICWCTYCGVPFAHEQHRKTLEALPSTTYPLEPQGDAAEVNETQRVTPEGFEQR
ncbi:hypothetical protein FQN54_009847 [Arachnomyces sp. PD_36]|nr:hypothetical protein FQN54_009847 [Arachnomyces sp. PD_36]